MKTGSMFFGLCRVTRAQSLGRDVAAEFFKCHFLVLWAKTGSGQNRQLGFWISCQIIIMYYIIATVCVVAFRSIPDGYLKATEYTHNAKRVSKNRESKEPDFNFALRPHSWVSWPCCERSPSPSFTFTILRSLRDKRLDITKGRWEKKKF